MTEVFLSFSGVTGQYSKKVEKQSFTRNVGNAGPKYHAQLAKLIINLSFGRTHRFFSFFFTK